MTQPRGPRYGPWSEGGWRREQAQQQSGRSGGGYGLYGNSRQRPLVQ